jgi:hypothetical protein
MLATPTPTTPLALWIAEPAVPHRRGTVPEWRSVSRLYRHCMRWTRLCRCCCAPNGAVQVGWSPRRAVLVRPPRGLTSAGLATLLRAMHSRRASCGPGARWHRPDRSAGHPRRHQLPG